MQWCSVYCAQQCLAWQSSVYVLVSTPVQSVAVFNEHCSCAWQCLAEQWSGWQVAKCKQNSLLPPSLKRVKHTFVSLFISSTDNLPNPTEHCCCLIGSKFKTQEILQSLLSSLVKPAPLIFRLLFGFAFDSLFVNLNKISTNSETTILIMAGDIDSVQMTFKSVGDPDYSPASHVAVL